MDHQRAHVLAIMVQRKVNEERIGATTRTQTVTMKEIPDTMGLV
jgi:hypothetical protein